MLLLNYASILILPLVTLLSAVFWYYRKLIAPYRGLPSISIVDMFKLFLLEKFPKDATATSYYFHRLTEMFKEFQSEGFCFLWLLHPYLVIFGEEAVKVFSNEQSAINKTHQYEIANEWLGEGLGTIKGDLWRKRRKMFNPAFGVSMVKDNVTVVNRNAEILVTELTKVQNKRVNILKQLQFCTLSNVCESVFGVDVNERKLEVENFMEFVNESAAISIHRVIYPWMHPAYTLRFFSEGRKFLKIVKDFREFTAKMLQEVIESELQSQTKIKLDKTSELQSVPRRSFAEIIVEQHLKDPSFTFTCMQDELTTMAVAGSDTVSYTLMWCLFLLGHHQEVQDQLFNELESVAGNDVTFDDLQKLTYMDCVVKETLRLYPTLPVYGRVLEKNVQCGKYNIPKGTNIVFFLYLCHRNPKVYPDPEKFDPDRFLEGNSERRPWAYIPFSEGIRSCIGKKFALMEIKIVMVHILRNFKVTCLDRKEDVKPSWEFMLTTAKPLNMRFTPRQDSD